MNLLQNQEPSVSSINKQKSVWGRKRGVDDLVAKVAAELEAAGAMKRTVFLYGSDHGYHSGQWALPYCKMMPYEEDVRIPLFARLPPASPPLREIAPRSQVRCSPGTPIAPWCKRPLWNPGTSCTCSHQSKLAMVFALTARLRAFSIARHR